MVINDKYRFVFLHVPKTAGSSLTAALGCLPGNNRRWIAKGTKHETLGQLQANWEQRRSGLDRLFRRAVHDYFFFGSVRNPWDRMCSLYRYLREKRPRPEIANVTSFPDFLRRAEQGEEWIVHLHSMRQQIEFLYDPTSARRSTLSGTSSTFRRIVPPWPGN